jgi:hypothetical protein
MGLSKAQEDALQKVYEIAVEHFEAAVMVVQYESGDNGEGEKVVFHGGWANARGFIEVGGDILREERPLNYEKED